MKVLVTGGLGTVGKAVVTRLVAGGYAVRVIDRLPQASVEGAEYACCDIEDYPALRSQARDCDAVIHLAALPQPAMGRADEIYRINTAGTFNVFQAAAEQGIRRVVHASSINALGLYWGVQEVQPRYFPLDEDHPSWTTDAYSFSKWIVEDIGRYFWRREGISSVALRLPAVLPAQAHAHRAGQPNFAAQLIEHLLKMPDQERMEWLEARYRIFREIRRKRQMEDADFWSRVRDPDSPLDEAARLATVSKYNFWAVIDERDAAQAFEKALTASYEGSYPLHVQDRVNWTGVESELLLKLFFPEVTARKRPLVGAESLVSLEQARQLIGFEPEFSFA